MKRPTPTVATPRRAVLYCRVSSAEQAKDDIKIDGQVRACREYCDRHGLTVVAPPYIDEGYSGGNFQRPAFQQLLADAKKTPLRFDYIVVWKLNRFGRSADAPGIDARLKSRGIDVLDTTQDFGEGRGSKLFKGLTYLVGADLRDQLREDVRRGQREAVLQGRHGTGGLAPYGYAVEYERDGNRLRRKFVTDPREAEVAKSIFLRYDRGASIRSIVTELNDSNVPTAAVRDGRRPRGRTHGLWLHGTVWRILRNPTYTGAYVYGRRETSTDEDGRHLDRMRPKEEHVVFEGAHEALVSKDMFERVKARLASNQQAHARPGKPPHFLAVVGKCAVCGGGLQHESNGRHYYFTCRTQRRLKHNRFDACRGTIRADYVEQYLTDNIIKLHKDTQRDANIGQRVQEYNAKAARIASDLGIGRLERIIAKHKAEVEHLIAFIADGDNSVNVRKRLHAAEEQARSAQERRDALEAKVQRQKAALDPRKVIQDLRALYLAVRRVEVEAFIAALPRVFASVAIDFTSDDVDDMVHIRPHYDTENLSDLEDSVLRDVAVASQGAQFREWVRREHG